MGRLWVAVAVAGLAAARAGAASPDPRTLAVTAQDLSKARGLIRKLGSDLFRDREQAETELAGMGRLARAALGEAARADPSPEVRSRSARLLPRAEAADLQARVDTFLADTGAEFQHDLPAWAAFRKAAERDGGSATAARGLYVELLQSRPNRELLVALGGPPGEAGRWIAERRIDMFLQMNPQLRGQFGPASGAARAQPLTLTDIAGLLFAESVVPGRDIPRGGPLSGVGGATFAQQAVSLNALSNPGSAPHADAYGRLLSHWLETRTATDELAGMVSLVARLPQMKEGTTLLRRVVATDGVMGWAKAQAVIALVQRHGKDERQHLRGLLRDTTEVGSIYLGQGANGMARVAPCQLRDVALALLIAQSAQDLKSYGFEVAPNNNPDPLRNSYPTYAFPADEDRTKAFKKWAAWDGEHPDPADATKK